MKNLFSFIVLIALLSILVLFFGCTSITKSTKKKQVNIATEIYGMKVVLFDPLSGSLAPTGWIGFGSVQYRSIPVTAGQPVFIAHEVRSIWNSEQPASNTYIYVGTVPEKAIILSETISNTLFKISLNGIKSGLTTVKLIPVKPNKPPQKETTAAAVDSD